MEGVEIREWGRWKEQTYCLKHLDALIIEAAFQVYL